jgi:SAM-dependent methyltransferase
MFGTGETFDYLECAACGTLRITSIPADLESRYENGYYTSAPVEALPSGLRARLETVWLRHLVSGRGLLGRLLAIRWRLAPRWVRWLRMVHRGFAERVLDVGCGDGRNLRILARLGYREALGIDPYAPAETDRPFPIRRRRIEEQDGEHDLILLASSLEHVADPTATLREARRLLAPGGRVLVRIPVMGGAAWDRYGVHWVQLDAPRHLHLMTPAGLREAASRAELAVVDSVYDSSDFQFWGSEQARRGIALTAPESHAVDPALSPFGDDEIDAWRSEAIRLDAEGRGDTAAFLLSPVGPHAK